MTEYRLPTACGALLLCVAVATAQVACGESGPLVKPGPGPWDDELCDVPFVNVTLPYGAQGYGEPRFFTVDNAADWCRVWDELFASAGSVPCDESLVDFSHEVAIVAAIGSRGTGGHSARVACIHAGDVPGAMAVIVLENAPESGCIVTQAFTYPFTVVKVEGPVTSASFETVVRRYDCD